MTTARKHVGIEVRHRAKCRTHDGGKCNCTPSFRAEAWDRVAGARVFKTWPTLASAKSWRSSMQVKIANGEAGVMTSPTLREAYVTWADKARSGVIRNNRGDTYQPSVLRGYDQTMRTHVLPKMGNAKLVDVKQRHVQDLVEKLVGSGLAASTVRNIVAPMRVVFTDAIRREQARINPCVGLQLPSGGESRDRIATPAEARALIAALVQDRALWATAFFAGLRAGELMALDWSCVDLTHRVIRVERSFDPKEGKFVRTKTRKGSRDVPFPPLLVPFLMSVRRPEGLVFSDDGVTPFVNTTIRNRALRAWEGAGLDPITPHECRHTYASHMLGAGVDIVKVSKWMGHSSIQITVDRYGHLVPGDELAAMDKFEAYLTAAGS